MEICKDKLDRAFARLAKTWLASRAAKGKEKERLKVRLNSRKAQILAVCKEAWDKGDPTLLRIAYFRLPDFDTSVSEIASFFGASAQMINKMAGNTHFPVKCSACEKIAGYKTIRSVRQFHRLASREERLRGCKVEDPENIPDNVHRCHVKAVGNVSSVADVADVFGGRLRPERLQEMKNMPYREYLRTPEWQRKAGALKRAVGYRCRVCNNSGHEVKLNVHHRTYERLGEEHRNDLIVLCQPCHEIFHDNGKLANYRTRS